MALEQGQRVGDYEVISLLGSGGMGRVYRVRNIISGREEAMKVLLPDYASEPELAARFVGEIRTLAVLEHPNIAQLRTAFQFENQLVMVMALVEGVTLESLAAERRTSVEQVLEYSSQVLSALSYAHSRGVTHRDIKPANIMITSHGLVKLMDFGIAKSTEDLHLTRPGTTMGSIYYMSPEQVRGSTVDARSDIYSFGVTLYEMLTGRRPFQAETSFSVLNAHLKEAPIPPVQINPALPPALNQIVLCAMAKEPTDRFQSADEMRNAIRGVQRPAQAAAPAVPEAAQAGPAAAWPPVRASAAPQVVRKSHRGLWIGIGAAVTLAALLAIAALLPHFFATQAEQKAQTSAADTQPARQASAAAPAAQTPAAAASVPVSPAQQGAGTPPGPGRPVNKPVKLPVESGPVEPAKLPQRSPATTGSNSPPASAGQPAPVVASQHSAPAGPSPKEVQNAHDRYADLGARADADQTGVESIRRQQQAQGFDIRGDILTAMNKLNNDMNEAGQALNGNDLASANQYMDRAERELATLESFLGR
ncbi:MAG: serine/threonine protein kinase [Terracidiphilus sp.]